MKSVVVILFLSTCLNLTNSLETKDIVIVVLSQENAHHVNLAEELRRDVLVQAQSLNQRPPLIHFSHNEFPHVGGWTVFPLIPVITKLHQQNASWVIFCNEVTRFNLHHLVNTLSKYDHTQEIWVGHGLHDREATIIHHFAFFNDPHSFSYPHIASGFAVSISLLKSLMDRISSFYESEVEFSIDAAHELALFVWNKNNGISLIDDPTFCVKNSSHCASYIVPTRACAEPVQNDNILYAVKTCKKFHNERVPIVKKTWAKYVTWINYFSEENDESIPTVNLGIPNTERGHCGKTLAILHHAKNELEQNPSISWVVIADDDTIISSSRLQNLLSCYNSTSSIALGERYGFKVYSTHGYNYITGGGGMVFSAPLVQLLTAEGNCECPSDHSPDDMYLGVCLSRLGIKIIHSPSFHQARPPDYALDYLASQEPVSFHKHWMIDPVSVYEQWFAEADQEFFTRSLKNQKHTEL